MMIDAKSRQFKKKESTKEKNRGPITIILTLAINFLNSHKKQHTLVKDNIVTSFYQLRNLMHKQIKLKNK
jgi:hypothetical protein